MRRVLALVAALIVAASMVWGFTMLTADVAVPIDGYGDLSCGGVAGSLSGDPSYGGEQPFPDDWVARCRDAAKDHVRWIAVPATAGPVALLYLVVAYIGLVRRTTAEDRADGTDSHRSGR